jgi:hypothetical protein
MSDEPTYQEQIAQWRQQRAQESIATRVEEIKNEYREAVTERDKLVAEGEIDAAAYWDDSVQRLDAEFQSMLPPQPPQAHPKVVRLARRNASYFQKYGQRAAQMADQAHNYVTGKMGISPDSPKYEDAVLTFMELYGASHAGTPYDRSEQALTPNQAAKISGLNPDQYNNASRTLAGQGRFTKKWG